MENKRIDIHNYKRRFDRTLERIEEDKVISKENKKVIILGIAQRLDFFQLQRNQKTPVIVLNILLREKHFLFQHY